MQLVRSGAAESAALELAISHALLTRVGAGALPSTLRVYRPAAAVAFGKLDALRPGFDDAIAVARRHGYEPVMRLPGGHAAAYNAQSVGIDVVWALEDPVPGTHERFAAEGERLAAALRALGVDARVGEVPGEYCPGAYSVNARGRVKLVGTAQRLIRGAALLGASIVVGDGPGVRAVLRDVYAALALEYDDASAGAVDEEVPVGLEAVEAAVLEAYGDLTPVELDADTLALARELVSGRLPPPPARDPVRST
jgi:lipoate-protein ligase A